jgi:hypothetical protein
MLRPVPAVSPLLSIPFCDSLNVSPLLQSATLGRNTFFFGSVQGAALNALVRNAAEAQCAVANQITYDPPS